MVALRTYRQQSAIYKKKPSPSCPNVLAPNSSVHIWIKYCKFVFGNGYFD